MVGYLFQLQSSKTSLKHYLKISIMQINNTCSIGTLKITLRVGSVRYTKYACYIVRNIGRTIVIRVEALDRELLYEFKDYIATLMSVSGVPVPVEIADRLCKKLCSAAYIYLWSTVPVQPTYESFEELRQALQLVSQ